MAIVIFVPGGSLVALAIYLYRRLASARVS